MASSLEAYQAVADQWASDPEDITFQAVVADQWASDLKASFQVVAYQAAVADRWAFDLKAS